MDRKQKALTASTIAVLTIPVAATLIGTGGGTAGAATALGPATNSCAGDGTASAPVGVPGGVFIPDAGTTSKYANSVKVASFGTGSLDGDFAAKTVPGGIEVETRGVGLGTLSGAYEKYVPGNGYVNCQVNGTFLLS
ncbi:hypothetical protein [Gordonia sp. OPL2]|uniref:hypothetical protein n=1 Tax=Gordonia sp. OPL2 TaxID=2486274 RepID=UPI001655AED9|nr:hypothetical protein [Gordonia sp. OPL2]ROZ98800.1 hypothetical protein EEB19_14245 [Gordonia sp. OPL2]